MQNIIHITENASKKFKEVIAIEGINKVRVSILGGGCAGLTTDLELKEETFDYDWVFELDGITFVVDAFSATLIYGTTIDYIDDFAGGFKFIPSKEGYISKQCCCGSSFEVV